MAYDVIVVGARVAGASTALLLARAGLRVLVLDRARFPSDTLSSHQLQLPGVARLRDWGLLEALQRTGTPPIRSMVFDAGMAVLRGRYAEFRGVDALYSPRRTVLDQLLIDAARAAGAEVREGVIVEDLLAAEGKIMGVRVRPKGGRAQQETATLVVGADGKHSTVARAVGARADRARAPRSVASYAYVEGSDRWAGPGGGVVYSRPDRLVGCWPTGDGLSVVYLAVPAAAFAAVRSDVDFRRMVAEVLPWGDARLVEHRRTTTDLPNLMRRPYGRGWLLVGDAGLVMDPITGQGIGNALDDAQAASAAIIARLGNGRRAAFREFHRARDQARRGMFDLTVRLASFRPDPAGDLLFRAIADDPAKVSRFFGLLAGTVPVREFFRPGHLRALVGTRTLLRMTAARLRA